MQLGSVLVGLGGGGLGLVGCVVDEGSEARAIHTGDDGLKGRKSGGHVQVPLAYMLMQSVTDGEEEDGREGGSCWADMPVKKILSKRNIVLII
jgi:hypothetical protein